MKKIYLISLFIFISISASAQFDLEGLIKNLKDKGLNKDQIEEVVKEKIKDPELYNEIWSKIIEQKENESNVWKFLNDLNLDFKTFQNEDSTKSSLGFSYDLNFEYSKLSEVENRRVSNSINLKAKGNIAFNKVVNPNDFLESSFNYSFTNFWGGVREITDEEIFTKLNDITDKLVNIDDQSSPEALALWKEFGNHISYSTQFFYSINPKFGLESNQDFSKHQFTPGLIMNFGAKPWNNSSTLSKFNLLDYPFAALRWIFGTDSRFTRYGGTFPTFLAGVDYVIPENDDVREQVEGSLNPFPRIRLETGFRTLISNIKEQSIFFNSSLRYYHEIGASNEIKSADLDEQIYFVMALQSSSGIYVSYASGNLPFDSKEDEIYSLGFNYKF